MPILYVSDLDGTLLQPDATLSDFARDSLNSLIDQGVAFTVASARSIYTIRETLEGLRLRLPVIEFNGAFISDLVTGAHELVNALDPELAAPLGALIARHGHDAAVSTYDGRRDRLYYARTRNACLAGYIENRRLARDPRLAHVPDLADIYGEHIVSFVVVGHWENLADLARAVGESFGAAVSLDRFDDTYRTGWTWLAMQSPEATKERALSVVMESHGFAAPDVVVFGDQMNDLSMFRLAGRSVAVANAADVVREAADEVIGPCSEDAVVHYIQQHCGAGVQPATL